MCTGLLRSLCGFFRPRPLVDSSVAWNTEVVGAREGTLVAVNAHPTPALRGPSVSKGDVERV